MHFLTAYNIPPAVVDAMPVRMIDEILARELAVQEVQERDRKKERRGRGGRGRGGGNDED